MTKATQNPAKKQQASTQEKRKTEPRKCEKCAKNAKNQQNFDIFSFAIDEKTKLVLLIKVLLCANRTIPNTIAILDKIIEKRASTFIPVSTIYGSASSTFSEVNHVIDLTQRKQKLLNIHVMGETLINSLPEDYRQIALLKYVKNYKADDIATITKTSPRTIFRKLKLIEEKLIHFIHTSNWNMAFLEDQIQNEHWLKVLYEKKYRDECANRSRSEHKKAP